MGAAFDSTVQDSKVKSDHSNVVAEGLALSWGSDEFSNFAEYFIEQSACCMTDVPKESNRSERYHRSLVAIRLYSVHMRVDKQGEARIKMVTTKLGYINVLNLLVTIILLTSKEDSDCGTVSGGINLGQ